MIETYAAVINAIAVLGSFIFVIVVSFKKSRRDRIDELKVEMQVLFSQGWDHKRIHSRETEEKFFESLSPKFKKGRYKILHEVAYDELGREGKNDAWSYKNLKRQTIEEKQKENLKVRIP